MKNSKPLQYRKLYVHLANLAELSVLTIFFYNIWLDELNILMGRYFQNKGNLLMVALYAVVLFVFFRVWGGLRLASARMANLMISQFFALLCTGVVEYFQIVLMVGAVDRLSYIAGKMGWLLALDVTAIVLMDLVFLKLYRRIFPPSRLLQVNGNYQNSLSLKFREREDRYRICEEVSVFDEELMYSRIPLYDAVLLNDIPSDRKNMILKYCFEHSIQVYFTPKISDIIVKGTEEINMFDSPLFLCRNMGLTAGQRFVKRTMDLVFSLLGLILASPIMLVTAACIKAYDRGPVFFRQERCTYGGKVFEIYKFRSMVENAEAEGKSRPATDDDARITPVGKHIRKARIDELPQLFNILKGDMSIVGPRPERTEHVEKYSREIPEFSYRAKMKGGLTGYAQVYGRYNTTAYDKLKMDLLYIVNYSVLLDLRIILETVKILFSKESTQGFTREQAGKIRGAEEARGK